MLGLLGYIFVFVNCYVCVCVFVITNVYVSVVCECALSSVLCVLDFDCDKTTQQ
jgi:hypothetical protein